MLKWWLATDPTCNVCRIVSVQIIAGLTLSVLNQFSDNSQKLSMSDMLFSIDYNSSDDQDNLCNALIIDIDLALPSLWVSGCSL